jgi:serine/threonine protein kinase
MAPEVVTGDYHFPADIHSLGQCIHCMLKSNNFSPDLKHLVQSMMDSLPQNRPTASMIFQIAAQKVDNHYYAQTVSIATQLHELRGCKARLEQFIENNNWVKGVIPYKSSLHPSSVAAFEEIYDKLFTCEKDLANMVNDESLLIEQQNALMYCE